MTADKDLPLSRAGAIALLLAATFLTASPVLRNDFVNWDDPVWVTENPAVKDLSLDNIQRIFTDHWQGRYSRFIPLTFVSYAIEDHFFGLSPLAVHLDSLLLHMVNVLLVFAVLEMLGAGLTIAFLTALLFGIHPIQMEPVAWATARMYPLCGMFALLTALTYVRSLRTSRNKVLWRILSHLLFILALTSHVAAVPLPLVLVLIDRIHSGRWRAKALLSKTLFVLLSSAAVALAWKSAHHADIISNSYFNDNTFSLMERVHLTSAGIFKYLAQLVLPSSFCGVYPSGYYLHPWNIAFTLLLAAALWAVFRPNASTASKVLRIGTAVFLINLAPFFQIYSTSDSITDDRYAYLPSIGIFLIIAYGLRSLLRRWPSARPRIAVTALVAIYMILTASVSYRQAQVWRNSGTFWSNVIRQYPRATPAYMSRAQYHFSRQEWDKALADTGMAIRLAPRDAEAHFLRGNTLLSTGRPEEARLAYSAVIALEPRHTAAFNNRGAAYLMEGNLDKALEDLTRSTELDPGQVDAFVNRGNIYLQKKDLSAARKDFENVLAKDPAHPQADSALRQLTEHLNTP